MVGLGEAMSWERGVGDGYSSHWLQPEGVVHTYRLFHFVCCMLDLLMYSNISDHNMEIYHHS